MFPDLTVLCLCCFIWCCKLRVGVLHCRCMNQTLRADYKWADLAGGGRTAPRPRPTVWCRGASPGQCGGWRRWLSPGWVTEWNSRSQKPELWTKEEQRKRVGSRPLLPVAIEEGRQGASQVVTLREEAVAIWGMGRVGRGAGLPSATCELFRLLSFIENHKTFFVIFLLKFFIYSIWDV